MLTVKIDPLAARGKTRRSRGQELGIG